MSHLGGALSTGVKIGIGFVVVVIAFYVITSAIYGVWNPVNWPIWSSSSTSTTTPTSPPADTTSQPNTTPVSTSTSPPVDTTPIPQDTSTYPNRIQTLENMVLNGTIPIAITEGITGKYLKACGKNAYCNNTNATLAGGYGDPFKFYMSKKTKYNSPTASEDRVKALEQAIFLLTTPVMIRINPSAPLSSYVGVCSNGSICDSSKGTLGTDFSFNATKGFLITVANYNTSPYVVPSDLGARITNLENAVVNGTTPLILQEQNNVEWVSGCGQYISCPGCFCGDNSSDSTRCNNLNANTLDTTACNYPLYYITNKASITTASTQAFKIFRYDSAPSVVLTPPSPAGRTSIIDISKSYNIENRWGCPSDSRCGYYMDFSGYTVTIANSTEVPWKLEQVSGTIDQFYIKNMWKDSSDARYGFYVGFDSTSKLVMLRDGVATPDNKVPWLFTPTGDADSYYITSKWHCPDDSLCNYHLDWTSAGLNANVTNDEGQKTAWKLHAL